MNKDEILILANKCNGEKTLFDYELVSVTFSILNLEKFAEAYHQQELEKLEKSCCPIGNEYISNGDLDSELDNLNYEMNVGDEIKLWVWQSTKAVLTNFVKSEDGCLYAEE
jgi:hypothetical protein